MLPRSQILKGIFLLFVIHIACQPAPIKQELKVDSSDPLKAYEFSKFIPEPPAKLYHSFIDPETLIKVWGLSDITIDPVPGGKASGQVLLENGKRNFTINYKELVPDEKLSWLVHFDSIPEKEIMTTLWFKKAKGGTNLTLRQENFITEAERDENRKAWETSLIRLEGLISWK